MAFVQKLKLQKKSSKCNQFQQLTGHHFVQWRSRRVSNEGVNANLSLTRLEQV